MRFHRSGARMWLYLPADFVLSFECGRVRGSGWVRFKWGADDGTQGVQVSAGWSFGAWLTLRFPWHLLRSLHFPQYTREFSVSWFIDTLRIALYSDEWGSAIGMSNNRHEWALWRNQWVTGRNSYTEHALMRTTGIVNCGEWDGDQYPVEVALVERTWRNRFRTMRRLTYDMRVPEGGIAPPMPGKGENSWDMDDDGIYAMGASADCGSVDAALAEYAARTIEQRRRHGSKNWRPASNATASENSNAIQENRT